MRRISRRGVVGGALATPLVMMSGRRALAADKIRFGKSVPNSFAFSTAEIGIDNKIWDQEGIELAVSAFRGDAQMQQALTAGAIDVAVGSGPGLGFRAGALALIDQDRCRSQGQENWRDHAGFAHRLVDA